MDVLEVRELQLHKQLFGAHDVTTDSITSKISDLYTGVQKELQPSSTLGSSAPKAGEEIKRAVILSSDDRIDEILLTGRSQECRKTRRRPRSLTISAKHIGTRTKRERRSHSRFRRPAHKKEEEKQSTAMSEWWAAIGKPFADALVSLDAAKISEAFVNAPHTYYEYIRAIYERSPEHVIIETFLIVFVIYIAFVKKDKPKNKGVKLSAKEIDDLVAEWTPEPIVPPALKDQAAKAKPIGIVESHPDTHIKLQGIERPLLNLATFDFLGLGSRKELKDTAVTALKKYGCGSCGPRGFYGTIDTHEILEKDIAKLIGTPDALTFSDTEATSSTVLPAFAKRGDLIVVDEGCNDSILVGATLARCTTLYYKHNNLDDLERVLKSVRDADKKAGRGSDCQRRYVVTESLFRNHGDMIDLPKVVALCEKYYFRLFLDESFSFGVLGANGRGITEHYDVNVADVAIICGSLAGAAAGVGGFSTGSQEVVDYQRINSAGYVFSASPPPFTSACTSEAIRIMRSEPQLFVKLRANANLAYDTLTATAKSEFHITSARESPILHVRLQEKVLERVGNEAEQRAVARAICDQVMTNLQSKGIAVISPRYKKHQTFEPMPSVRVSVSAIHSKKDIESACKTIGAECIAVAKQLLSARSKSRN